MKPPTLSTGDELTADFVNRYMVHESGAWRTWTPTVLQNGSITVTTVNEAKYAVVGRLCVFMFDLTLGSTGTANYFVRVSTPLQSSSRFRAQSIPYDANVDGLAYGNTVGTCSFTDSSSASAVTPRAMLTDGTADYFVVPTSTAVGSGDRLEGVGWIELANDEHDVTVSVGDELEADVVNDAIRREGDAWTTYSPQVRQGGTALTRTVNHARYARIGRIAFFQARVTLGASGTASNLIRIGLPALAANTGDTVGRGLIYDDSATRWYDCTLQLDDTIFIRFEDSFAGGLTSPTLASGDEIWVAGTYETAS